LASRPGQPDSLRLIGESYDLPGDIMARIDLINVSKTLKDRARGGSRATFSIRDLNLTVPDGKTMVVLGPSGCGKTTLLKVIAGLIPPDAGVVRYDHVEVKDVPPGARRIGMVFQNYALYPHFTVRTNVLSYFLFRKKTPELDALAKAKYQRTSELMGVELAYLLDRKPTTLSGGEKQRVALGRCITRDATLFLVDEPFANLDQALREKYRVNLKVLLRQFDITTVYVTHDHHEALILADLLAIMNHGTIEQAGTPQEIYDVPTNVFVASFLNIHVGAPAISLLDARWLPQGQRLGNMRVGVRPEDVEISGAECEGSMSGTVTAHLNLPLKNASYVSIRVGDDEVHAQTDGRERRAIGDRIWLTFKRYHVFDKTSGARLGSHPERH
jgi:multiple sugar transport system ATP-binding protein